MLWITEELKKIKSNKKKETFVIFWEKIGIGFYNEGRRGTGRKQVSSLKNIPEWRGINSAEKLFKLAENNEKLSKVKVREPDK